VFGWRRGKKNQGLRIFVDFSFLFRIGGRGRITTFCWSEYETGARQPIARPFIYIYFQPFFFSPADYAGPWYYNRNTSSSTTTTSRNRREKLMYIFLLDPPTLGSQIPPPFLLFFSSSDIQILLSFFFIL
jgi:hypothetical protein